MPPVQRLGAFTFVPDSSPIRQLDISNNTKLTSICFSNMPNLYQVCVWTMPFPPEGVEVDTSDSPNVYFTTECATGLNEYKKEEFNIYPNP
jgi:hypothetical protein